MRVERLDGTRRLLVRVGLIALAFAVSFVMVYWVTVRTVPGRLVADASLRGALLTGSGVTAGVDAVLNVVSVASLLAAVAAVAVIALLRLDRLHGAVAVGILVGSNVSTWLLKDMLLVRPDLGLREAAPATLNSLPSGHTTAAFSVVAAVLFVAPPRWRLALATVGGGYSAVTALATMSAGWHRAGDSIASFALVGLCTTAGAAVVILARAPLATSARVRPSGSSSARWLAACSAGSVTLGGAIVLALAAMATVLDSTVGSTVAFLAGGLLITGSAAAALIGVLAALDTMDSAATTLSGGAGGPMPG